MPIEVVEHDQKMTIFEVEEKAILKKGGVDEKTFEPTIYTYIDRPF
jgi:hypothetical protein